MSKRKMIVLTGGPGGGKTTLINELRHGPDWSSRFVNLPEAISVVVQSGISIEDRLFQKAMVRMQVALEDGLASVLDPTDTRFILCHRGTLDPLAYWLAQGWSEEEFCDFTQTRLEEHYQRYVGVVHLVTAADGAEDHYERWPRAQRGETPEKAAEIDRLLNKVWGNHPRYYRIENYGVDWPMKSKLARDALERLLE